MNEALTAAEEAKQAAPDGNFAEARTLLGRMEERLEAGKGGNAAHNACRLKILRVEAEACALLKAAGEETEPTPALTPIPLGPSGWPTSPIHSRPRRFGGCKIKVAMYEHEALLKIGCSYVAKACCCPVLSMWGASRLP
ncbi:hypothetical protein K7W42_22615 [Deinococcus sp. HMF7604]|uniref:hypothetical protein n=1 Tax=Deinococcus betulae TaxID=2873312 RepID=UPI001CCA9E29|nr:hypothetical protein [Deinococcus betulae]MBZ9753620.1 hypothetical protein [Deinococcus betulae]